MRSLDWSIYIRDPLTEIPLYNTTILIIREPDDGYWSFIPEFAGSIGCWHGINAQGLAIGENSCITTDATYEGICPWFRMRMVMDTAANAEEAIDILTENITCGTNFILSDATIPTGYALDQTASISYVGSWNDPVEATSPFWQIQDVVRRVPQYVHPDCAAVERNRLRYDPGGLFGIFCIATRLSYMHVGWTHYKALSNEIDRLHGSLDATGLMSLLRNEYAGDTDIFMKIYRNSGYYLHCLYQWVCCPETGEFLISFAENDTLACYNDVPVSYTHLTLPTN